MRSIVVTLACLGAGMAHAGNADDKSAEALRAMHGVVRDQLSRNQFQRPISLESGETADSVKGDIHALINSPFATMSAVLTSAGNWCDIMMLHINTKHCRASIANQQDVLNISIGKKYDQPLKDAYPVAFSYRVASQTTTYLRVQLNADEGPLSTRDYRIVLEAIPMDGGQTFVRLSYSYGYGRVGWLAMQAYFGTVGGNKAGFTVVGKQSSGEPLYVGGMRGLVERNTMRYYLAIEAYLGAWSLPSPARIEKSLHDWFAATERYPRQLHEMEQNDYLSMKRREYARQRAGTRVVPGPATGA